MKKNIIGHYCSVYHNRTNTWHCLHNNSKIFPVALPDGIIHCKMLLERSFQCIDFSNVFISKSADYTIQHEDYIVCNSHLGIVFIDTSKSEL